MSEIKMYYGEVTIKVSANIKARYETHAKQALRRLATRIAAGELPAGDSEDAANIYALRIESGHPVRKFEEVDSSTAFWLEENRKGY